MRNGKKKNEPVITTSGENTYGTLGVKRKVKARRVGDVVGAAGEHEIAGLVVVKLRDTRSGKSDHGKGGVRLCGN